MPLEQINALMKFSSKLNTRQKKGSRNPVSHNKNT